MECSICGSEDFVQETIDRKMTELGTDTVLLKNLPVYTCSTCGEKHISIPRYNVVMQQIKEQMCNLERPLNGGEFCILRGSLELNGQECAVLLGVTNVSISRWENNQVPINPTADRMMRTLTLQNLGYESKQIVKRLCDTEKKGIEEIEIDIANFKATPYRYNTCQSFGDGENATAWVLINE